MKTFAGFVSVVVFAAGGLILGAIAGASIGYALYANSPEPGMAAVFVGYLGAFAGAILGGVAGRGLFERASIKDRRQG